MQTELQVMGSVTRPKYQHPHAEIRACKSKAQACRVALLHAGMTQDTAAERLDKTAGYVSMLLSGKRDWPGKLLTKFMNVTGSLAPLQWDAMQEGVELYADPIKVELAQLEARKAELMRAAA